MTDLQRHHLLCRDTYGRELHDFARAFRWTYEQIGETPLTAHRMSKHKSLYKWLHGRVVDTEYGED